MSIQINYKNNTPKDLSANLVLFVEENFNISGLKKHISNSEFSYINDLLKTNSANLILFVDENFNISILKKYISLNQQY